MNLQRKQQMRQALESNLTGFNGRQLSRTPYLGSDDLVAGMAGGSGVVDSSKAFGIKITNNTSAQQEVRFGGGRSRFAANVSTAGAHILGNGDVPGIDDAGSKVSISTVNGNADLRYLESLIAGGQLIMTFSGLQIQTDSAGNLSNSVNYVPADGGIQQPSTTELPTSLYQDPRNNNDKLLQVAFKIQLDSQSHVRFLVDANTYVCVFFLGQKVTNLAAAHAAHYGM